MFRMTLMSLLLGLVSLIATIQLLRMPPTSTGQLPVIAWNAASALVESGAGTRAEQNLHLKLTPSGQALVKLPISQIPSSHYPFLHLSATEHSNNLSISIVWSTAQTGQEVFSYQIEDRLRNSLWLATHELKGWTGDITSLGLEITGQPDGELVLNDLSIFPASLSRQLKAIYSDWASFVPWKNSSINRYAGVTSVASFYPVPIVVTFMTLSLIAYGLILFILRKSSRFNWRVVALIFLACWIILDLAWQGKLIRQLGETHETFAGKSTQQKLAVGPDAELVSLMTEVKQQLESEDSRIFVSSTDDYLGMRGAYYLYPFNVYWKLRGAALPDQKYLHSGDYIVLIQPSRLRFDSLENKLSTPKKQTLSVEPIISRRMGSLFRVR